MKQEPLLSYEPEEIWQVRMLMFIETGPQTGKFQQVLLNSNQYLNVIKSAGTITKSYANGSCDFNLKRSAEVYTLPDLQPKLV